MFGFCGIYFIIVWVLVKIILFIPCADMFSIHPWSIDFNIMCVYFDEDFISDCVDNGDKNHIVLDAYRLYCVNINLLVKSSIYDLVYAPNSIKISGNILYRSGIIIIFP